MCSNTLGVGSIRRRRAPRWATTRLAIVVTFFLFCGCVQKSITKPHSEIVEEAKNRGVDILSVEEERERFQAWERDQQARLLDLIRNRTEGESRDPNYILGPGDELEVSVFEVPELNLTTRVRGGGFVALPLIGGIEAAGLTEAELQKAIHTKLKEFVRNPQVNVFVTRFGSQRVAVLGAVRKPGTYPLKKGDNSIVELISEAGGVTEKAGNYLSLIPAEQSGIGAKNDVEARARLAIASRESTAFRNRSIEVFLDQVLGTDGGIPLDVPVRGGDMVIIPESGKVMVEGEVTKVGAYALGQRMTLIGALAAAGGITSSAKVDEVEVIRDVGVNEKARLVLDLESLAGGEGIDPRLKDGDIVRVPSDRGERLSQDTFESITKIINFGVGGHVNLAGY